MNVGSGPTLLFFATVLAGYVGGLQPAYCQDPGFNVGIELSVAPQQPNDLSDTLLNVRLYNIGVADTSTFSPELSIDNNSIDVVLKYVYEGTEVLPTSIRMAPAEIINLGRLRPGDYNISTTFPSPTGVILGSSSLTFAVVPEPEAMLMVMIASAMYCGARRQAR